MINTRSRAQKDAMASTLENAYMEVFPTATIEDRLSVLKADAHVAVTCSPTRGVEETLEKTQHLAERGFQVIPHIAARSVRDRDHLRDILRRLSELEVESVFVPGGDAKRPVGDYSSAYELLRDMAELGHSFKNIGVACHPEGHPDVDSETLLTELEKKQELSNYMVSQMCFDAGVLGSWLADIRQRGIHLEAWLGIPGVGDRASLLKTSLRIGVGDSLRFLRKRSDVATKMMRAKSYAPDRLLEDIAPLLLEPGLNIAGYHIYCFNLVAAAEQWRRDTIAQLKRE